jgi:protein-L-isoaspartate O-methyltransferase
MPSAVVGMLAELDAQPGDRVLEIGTGTGFNAALLGNIVGHTGHVTSVEVDDQVAAGASAALASAGVENVTVNCADAVTTVEPGRWDRVIATAGVHMGRLPYHWVGQAKPGAVILAPMRTDLASGPLVRFVVGSDGIATGHAVKMRVGFMELRSQRVAASQSDLRWNDETADVTYTDVMPWNVLLAENARWALAVALPSCRYDIWEKTEDRPGVAWLRDPVSGSWAGVVRDGDRYAVRQSGPRRLWDQAEAAYRWWLAQGSPPIEAWEWTVTPDRQSVALPTRH